MHFSILCLGMICVSAQATVIAQDRPNIVFVFSDDHATQAISAYGGILADVAPTPNLDRIAEEGMLFRRCMVGNSICGPSRATILTGKHSHMNGFMVNDNTHFDGSQQTFPKLLQKAGYQTAVIGKWHLGSEPTGFDHWEVLPGQGNYYNPDFITTNGTHRETGYVTEIITEKAKTWIDGQRDKSKPFILMVQHKAPHRNWAPALEYLTAFDQLDLPEPDTLFDNYEGRGTAAREQDMSIEKTMTLSEDLKVREREIHREFRFSIDDRMTPEQLEAWNAAYQPKNTAFLKAGLRGKDLVRWKYQRYLKDYLRCIKSVDDSVGELHAHLEKHGLADNTVFIYSSDQGFYLGEHGWFDKRFMYDESYRTPLLVSWPGVVKPGSVNADLVSNLDFAETFLDIAGVDVPSDMQGASLVPILKGETPEDWRKTHYYHYYEYPGWHMVHRHEGVYDGRYKLMNFYDLGEWELYDLESDPKEMTNQYGNPEYAEVLKRMRDGLKALRIEYQVPENVAMDPETASRHFHSASLRKYRKAAAEKEALKQNKPSSALMDGPPNVLLIIADDLNDFISPLRGHVPNLTPNMDRLAASGVSFNNAQANGLSCAPSRTSMLSGLYPTTSGYYGGPNNGKGHRRNNPVLRDAVTLPEAFLDNGYATFLTGKIYHVNAHAEFEHFPGDKGGRDGFGIPHDFGPWPWDGKGGVGYMPPNVHPSARPPFDKLPYNGYSRLSDIPEYAPDPANGIPGYKGWVLRRKPWRYVNADERDLLPDESSVAWASEIMHRERNKPFFLAVGFNRPHTPMYVPDSYYDMFPLDEIKLPPMPAGDLEDVPADAKEGKAARLFRIFVEHAGEQGLKEYLQAYLASIRFVDDQVAALLKALAESPAASNTVVVLTSDHGFHLGEKERFGKSSCWERSTHVPLIFAGSGVEQAGVKVDAPVSLVDVYPTLLELCRLPPAPNKGREAPALDGHSLVPFLSAGSGNAWQGSPVALSATGHARTVRSKKYRYILHNGGGEELYDMENDPHEFRNLAPNTQLDVIKQELRNQLESLGKRKHGK